MPFFLGILVLFFALWLAGGGPERPISFSGPYLNPITGPGEGAEAYGDPDSYSSINSTIGVGPGGVSISGNPSTHQGSVTLARDLSGVRSSEANEEYLIVSLSASAKTSVSMGGWKLMNEKGTSVVFPQGTEVASAGRVNTLAPITLKPGDRAIVSTGRSPVGVSFRENLCTGYLEENQNFRPALSMNCPAPSEEFDRFYDGDDASACETFVGSISYCAAETDVPSSVGSECESFVEDHLDYNGCVAAHAKDKDFADDTWRVFLGLRSELWSDDSGTITLIDSDSNVIDSVSY